MLKLMQDYFDEQKDTEPIGDEKRGLINIPNQDFNTSVGNVQEKEEVEGEDEKSPDIKVGENEGGNDDDEETNRPGQEPLEPLALPIFVSPKFGPHPRPRPRGEMTATEKIVERMIITAIKICFLPFGTGWLNI